MTARLLGMAVRVLAATTLLVVCGCTLFPVRQRAASQVVAPAVKPGVLVLILDASTARERANFRSVVIATARTGEQLIVISAADGATLGSFAAPTALAMTGPAFPMPPSRDATSFQRASYRKNLRHAFAVLRHDRALLRIRQHSEVRAWADRAVASALSAAYRQTADRDGLASAITEAVADVAALQQSGLQFGPRKVIAIIGIGDAGASAPQLNSSLNGMEVAVADVPDGGAAAAWQADLLQAGASRAFVLTAATDSRLPAVVSTGLDGPAVIAFQLTQINYRPAQYQLPPSADPSLRELLYLLTVSYPQASATINGYTDNIAVPGGNLALSWKRAKAVLSWLTSHGVSADRLQAIGHGQADPVAPNRPGGQPLNRRVVVIISPNS